MLHDDCLLSPEPLVGMRVKLRPPASRNDYDSLHSWHTDLRNFHLWAVERRIMTYGQFMDDLEGKLRKIITTLFVIEDIESTELVGMTYLHNYSSVDQYAYLCTYLTPTKTAQGLGVEAGWLIANYAFSYMGLRKLYAEVFEYNSPSLKAAKRNGFVEEGCLKHHRWYKDRIWDMHILALTRDKFWQIPSPFSDTGNTIISG